ncbi:MAG TPA: hypothetical protein VFE12_05125 [Acetobacteraceae bacterium]|jgi:hypothetical protein|nr:hypothetical protein [Acetobacteraceae bacterium]
MRWLSTVLFVLCLSGLAIGQGRAATVELDGGRILQGRVLQMDVDHLVLQLADGRTETIEARHILSCNLHRPGDDGKAAKGSGEQASAAQDPQPSPHASHAAGRSIAMQRLSDLHHRYPWLAPEEPLQWISLVTMLFALASIGIHAAARIAGSDLAHFGRAVGLAAGLLVTGVLQLAIVSGGPAVWVGVMAINAITWLLLLRFVFDLTLGGAFVALFATLAEGGVLFLLIELADKIMRSIGGGWVLQ